MGGAAGVSVGRTRPCGQTGREVHVWTSRTSPIAPAQIHSHICRIPSPELPWLPICVATPCGLGERAGLKHIVRERFFYVYVLADLHRSHGSHRMHVVRRDHGHRVNAAVHLAQHHPKIFISLGLRIALAGVCGALVIHVAQGHDILERGSRGLVLPARALQHVAASADSRNVEPVTGSPVAGAAKDAPRDDHDAAGDKGLSLQERPAREH